MQQDDLADELKDKFDVVIGQPLFLEQGSVNPACMNELKATLDGFPPTHQRLADDPEWTRKRWTFKHDILGAFACQAVRCSPYDCPEGLEEVIKYLRAAIDKPFSRSKTCCMAELSLCDINKMLYDVLMDQGVKVFEAWNKPKIDSGQEIVFTSRYDQVDQDHDFIDLHALLHQTCVQLRDEWRIKDKFDKEFEEKYGGLSDGEVDES